ncbi:DUF1826 domain-containing protein [Thalassotalea euphylliae]|uniref:DUF1826 domain-containing protein n=2 Tax=Thalassotalea euphylliae TaxID=1655234 RepID=A0A3E0TX71_9GAMM|nr:DUF1826 domain-containing protein [Thalassotalea euphylliae]
MAETPKRKASAGTEPAIFTRIYQADINLSVWQEAMPAKVMEEANQLLTQATNVKAVMTTDPENVVDNLIEQCDELSTTPELCQHIALLVDMFCTLFELERVGLRLTHLTHAMCPKFHVDKVPCRLVATYTGNATEWLPNECVNRAKLGFGSQGLPDERSGIIRDLSQINQLNAGDVALLKGESWHDNEGGGLVHRSPRLADNEQRLLLTLDFSD